MGRPNPDEKPTTTPTRSSKTLPSSPTHSSLSSSSSEFEFMTISLSPRKSSASATADDLFYKGQLLPLHLSPRLSMVRSLLLSSSSTSSSATTVTSSSRPSTSSSRPSSATDSDTSSSSSSRPSSATADDELKRLKYTSSSSTSTSTTHFKKPNKYLSSLSRFSSVFRVKENKVRGPENMSGSSVKRAKEVFRKYLKKVKPLYNKLSSSSQKHQQSIPTNYSGNLSLSLTSDGLVKEREKDSGHGSLSHSFSGNLLYPRKKASATSCPSSMRSSPNHSGLLYRNGLPAMTNPVRDSSSMEELQSAIQGAIAHCKKSMVENKISMVSGEI
ncbi:hypothetical protein RHMOL_Rhmol04G0333500 [Rhododendron molle]|uniref:Uncharacterized protein n=1 Tax=Rhododendron molle TaxID=49168 RepID=A0ACC0P9E9_RHOML|nr:hypothetical protein RHMOL_Rhmol04G0333500 [Rhododendron molle]